jgi:hypothetical protein
MERLNMNDIFNFNKEETLIREGDEPNELKKFNPFEAIVYLFNKADGYPKELIESSAYSQFMINRIIACYRNFKKEFMYIDAVGYVNTLKLTNRQHWDFWLSYLKKIDKPFVTYLFNGKQDDVVYDELVYKSLKWKYNYNRRGANQARLVCLDSEIDEIVKEYKEYCKERNLKV